MVRKGREGTFRGNWLHMKKKGRIHERPISWQDVKLRGRYLEKVGQELDYRRGWGLIFVIW